MPLVNIDRKPTCKINKSQGVSTIFFAQDYSFLIFLLGLGLLSKRME